MDASVNLNLDREWWAEQARPLVIAGPCSAESESQVRQVALALAGIGGVQYLRAGVWKPRTRPGGFEGAGLPAFEWLKEARKKTGLKLITEVGARSHVEKALAAGLDAVWIGARTAANPFLMDEIAASLLGVDIPVFVKNPVSPDLELWIGALERLNRVGVRRLVAIHRGFTTMDSAPLRNSPLWEIAEELKRRIPGLPIILDPSHMAGQTRYIAELVRESRVRGLHDGMMVEVHPDPSGALSDPLQQLRPEEFRTLLREYSSKS